MSLQRNSKGQFVVGQTPSRLAAYPPGAMVTVLNDWRAMSDDERRAHIRARKRDDRERAITQAEFDAEIALLDAEIAAGDWDGFVPFDDDPGPVAA